MCGIAGAKDLNRLHLNLQAHRGPSETSLQHFEYINIGHNRLSIIDLSGGRQPMRDDVFDVTITFNGEIYNYIELKKELIKEHNVAFKTQSDTEVLLKMFIHYGIDKALEKANGMFAFAILDNRNDEQILYLARDRIGKKPLFYSTLDNTIRFASDINILYDILKNRLTFHEFSFSLYFNLFYIPAPYTIWKEIHSLEPGWYLKYFLKYNELYKVKYYRMERNEQEKYDIDELEALLADATKIRMRCDVDYGAYLSGGIDSTLITKLMTNVANPVNTFTAVINDEDLNEKSYAYYVSQTLNTTHHEIQIDYEKIFIQFLRSLVGYFGQPFADSSIIPTYLISHEIAKNVVVALGGDGADEIFAGYTRYSGLNRNAFYIPHVTRLFYRNKNLSFLSQQYKHNIYEGLKSLLDYNIKDNKEFMRALDMRVFLEGDILQKIDRLSMANSLEVRSPFLDYRVIEYANRLPHDVIFSIESSKSLLRKILSKYFMQGLYERPKVGFMLNTEQFRHATDLYLYRSKVHKAEFFANSFTFKKSIKYDSYTRFAMLMFVLWFERYCPEYHTELTYEYL